MSRQRSMCTFEISLLLDTMIICIYYKRRIISLHLDSISNTNVTELFGVAAITATLLIDFLLPYILSFNSSCEIMSIFIWFGIEEFHALIYTFTFMRKILALEWVHKHEKFMISIKLTAVIVIAASNIKAKILKETAHKWLNGNTWKHYSCRQ